MSARGRNDGIRAAALAGDVRDLLVLYLRRINYPAAADRVVLLPAPLLVDGIRARRSADQAPLYRDTATAAADRELVRLVADLRTLAAAHKVRPRA